MLRPVPTPASNMRPESPWKSRGRGAPPHGLARMAWDAATPSRWVRVGVAALVANAASFGLLWAYRGGDANMRSAWICARNDVLGNLAVLLAALDVLGTGTGWPDVMVASIMAILGPQGAWTVLNQSRAELCISTSPA